MKKVLFLLTAAALWACNNNQQPDDHTPEQVPGHEVHTGDHDVLMNSMKSMEDGLQALELTGDFDHDFANAMVIHHVGAIDMAKAYLQHGSDSTLKALAAGAVSSQQLEVDTLRSYTKNRTPVGTGKAEKHTELADQMTRMMTDMKNMQHTGNIDRDFAVMMIAHHKGALEMSQSELTHGKDEKIKNMAKKMISDQSREIELMESWLKSH